jgi:tetratricopeptide (TPR) repeat protein
MKQVACTECQQLAPIGETLLVKQQHVCSSCVEGVLAQAAEKGITKNDVFRASDPTVCTQCKADNGAEELPHLAGMPVCATCEDRFRNRPYPTWLKLAFIGLLTLAVFSFGWNWRFLAATREIHQMQRALLKQDFERAANFADQASRHVPEIPEFAGMAAFNHGLDALAKDQAAQAVDYLRKAKQSPNSGQLPEVDLFLLRAEAIAAFDAKQYDDYLAKAKALIGRTPGDSSAVAMVASAYACKYAVTGNEEFRNEALKNLERAAKMAGKDPDAANYRERILYRIDTREILTRKEFERRFPHGYQPKAKP